MKKRIAKFYVRYGRGESLLNIVIELIKVTVYFGALQYIMKDWFGIILGKNFAIAAVLVYTLLCYIAGYLDEKYGIWKLQNDYSAKELTPFFAEIERKIDLLQK